MPSDDELTNIAEVYANAFAGEPWNEFTWCKAEEKFYGPETEIGDKCNCGTGLVAA